jgi:hypothetical protein
MVAPYVPTPFPTGVVNPGVATQGATPIPYLSNSQYTNAPTAIDSTHLAPGGVAGQQAQALADTLARASSWVDAYCFGADLSENGASLAASLAVESSMAKVKNGELRLICDYKPVLELVGCDIGPTPGSVSTASSFASMVRFGRRTIYIQMGGGIPFRTGDTAPAIVPASGERGSVFAVWSYVSGYAHTQLAADVAVGDTSCSVAATDGNGGLWGVYPGQTRFRIADGAATETISVLDVTPNGVTTTLTTSAFQNAHSLPGAPDFIPVTTLPSNIEQAAISMTTMLIKTRGARALVMPQTPGGQPNRQAFAQAGALEDWDIATGILARYTIRLKSKQ